MTTGGVSGRVLNSDATPECSVNSGGLAESEIITLKDIASGQVKCIASKELQFVIAVSS